MLKYILTDIDGQTTHLSKSLSMSFVSSSDSPADSLRVTFAVDSPAEEIYSVKVLDGAETVFFGYADEQTETVSGNGIILTVKARSLAALLLDNEAMPQVYCLPTMDIIFEQHLKALGFTDYSGENYVCKGDLIITKGMSEWEMLCLFCSISGIEKPYVTSDGSLTIGKKRETDTVFLDSDSPKVKFSRIIKRNALISDIYIRTSKDDGYNYHMENNYAKKHKGTKIRYFNSADNFRRSPAYAGKLMTAGNHAFINCTAEIPGIVSCRTGDSLKISGKREKYIITEVRYNSGQDGERTIITAEVEE